MNLKWFLFTTLCRGGEEKHGRVIKPVLISTFWLNNALSWQQVLWCTWYDLSRYIRSRMAFFESFFSLSNIRIFSTAANYWYKSYSELFTSCLLEQIQIFHISWHIFLWRWREVMFTYEIVDSADFPSPAFASGPLPGEGFEKFYVSLSLFMMMMMMMMMVMMMVSTCISLILSISSLVWHTAHTATFKSVHFAIPRKTNQKGRCWNNFTKRAHFS